MKKHFILSALLFSILSFQSFFAATHKSVTGSLEFVLEGIFLDVDQDGVASIGDNIAYTITITNNGDENVDNVLLYNNLLGFNGLNIGSLGVGESTSFNSNYVISAEDLGSTFITTSAVVSATTASGGNVTDESDYDTDPSNGNSNPTIVELSQNYSSLELIKTAVISGSGQVGDIITYSFVVTNTGNTTIHDIVINDALTGSGYLAVNPSNLNPGESAVATVNYTITMENLVAGFVVNSATVMGFNPSGNQVTDVSDDGIAANGNDNPTTIQLTQSPLWLYAILTVNDINQDLFANAGDTITITYTVKNAGSTPLNNITITATPAVSVPGDPIPVLQPGETVFITGTYTITQEDVDNGILDVLSTVSGETPDGEIMTQTYSSTLVLSIPGSINLNAFIDANGNNAKDAGEVGFSLGHFRYVVNDNGLSQYIYPYFGQADIYGYALSDSYDLYFEIDPEYASLYNLATNSYEDVMISSDSEIDTYNFPLTAISPYHDLKVAVLPTGLPPRPGFDYQNLIEYTNNGNQAIASGTITFNTNGVAMVNTVSEPSAAVTATGFTYNFTDLQPFETRTMYVNMSVPTIPTVSLDQLLTNTVNGVIAGDDAVPANNNDFVTQMIVGSWDPNDKTEKHGGKILFSDFTSDDYLTYTIQFENTGTANAVNVKVTDELDAMLDENTVRMVGASAPYVLERFENELTWKFDGIELPPSEENTTIGHGYITFEVKPKPGFQLDDVIPNMASIYFDFNPAIVTNTFETAFVAQLGVNDIIDMDFTVYPNPASDKVTVSLKDNQQTIDTISLMDLSGKVLLNKNVSAASADITLSGISSGMYVLKIQSEGQVKVVKITRK